MRLRRPPEHYTADQCDAWRCGYRNGRNGDRAAYTSRGATAPMEDRGEQDGLDDRHHLLSAGMAWDYGL